MLQTHIATTVDDTVTDTVEVTGTEVEETVAMVEEDMAAVEEPEVGMVAEPEVVTALLEPEVIYVAIKYISLMNVNFDLYFVIKFQPLKTKKPSVTATHAELLASGLKVKMEIIVSAPDPKDSGAKRTTTAIDTPPVEVAMEVTMVVIMEATMEELVVVPEAQVLMDFEMMVRVMATLVILFGIATEMAPVMEMEAPVVRPP